MRSSGALVHVDPMGTWPGSRFIASTCSSPGCRAPQRQAAGACRPQAGTVTRRGNERGDAVSTPRCHTSWPTQSRVGLDGWRPMSCHTPTGVCCCSSAPHSAELWLTRHRTRPGWSLVLRHRALCHVPIRVHDRPSDASGRSAYRQLFCELRASAARWSQRIGRRSVPPGNLAIEQQPGRERPPVWFACVFPSRSRGSLTSRLPAFLPAILRPVRRSS